MTLYGTQCHRDLVVIVQLAVFCVIISDLCLTCPLTYICGVFRKRKASEMKCLKSMLKEKFLTEFYTPSLIYPI